METSSLIVVTISEPSFECLLVLKERSKLSGVARQREQPLSRISERTLVDPLLTETGFIADEAAL